MLVLIILALLTLGVAGYYAWTDLTEHEEMETRLRDLEVATEGYCKGKLNGAYTRMLKRQRDED